VSPCAPAKSALGRWWQRYVGAIAFVMVLIIGAIGFWQNDSRQQSQETERKARVKAQAEINFYVCSENNKQDRILASLLAISIGNASDKPLTKRQSSALAVFEEALRQLRALTPCNALAEAFLEASNTDDYRAIRRVLRAQDSFQP
jgi:hypothetical protein